MQIGCVFCIAASAYATPVSLEEAVVIGSENHALAKIQESKREVIRLLLREKWREYKRVEIEKSASKLCV